MNSISIRSTPRLHGKTVGLRKMRYIGDTSGIARWHTQKGSKIAGTKGFVAAWEAGQKGEVELKRARILAF